MGGETVDGNLFACSMTCCSSSNFTSAATGRKSLPAAAVIWLYVADHRRGEEITASGCALPPVNSVAPPRLRRRRAGDWTLRPASALISGPIWTSDSLPSPTFRAATRRRIYRRIGRRRRDEYRRLTQTQVCPALPEPGDQRSLDRFIDIGVIKDDDKQRVTLSSKESF